MIAETQAIAASIEGKPASRVRVSSGRGVSLTQMRVRTPSVPSAPTSRLASSGPPSACEKRATVPSGITASTASTWLVVTPYFRQRGPPAFSAALPPIVETLKLAGSGA